MLRRLLLMSALLIFVSSSAEAFNGLRKGFVLGGGLGVSPGASWSAEFDNAPDAGETNAGFGLHFLIGYAWDERNMIVYEGNGAGYYTDVGIFKDIAVGQGFGGAAWYHYFGDMGSSFFTTVGLGFYAFSWDYDDGNASGDNDPGGGLLLGAGYEFTDHVQIGIYAGGGRTEEPNTGLVFDHGHINVLISAVAF